MNSAQPNERMVLDGMEIFANAIDEQSGYFAPLVLPVSIKIKENVAALRREFAKNPAKALKLRAQDLRLLATALVVAATQYEAALEELDEVFSLGVPDKVTYLQRLGLYFWKASGLKGPVVPKTYAEGLLRRS